MRFLRKSLFWTVSIVVAWLAACAGASMFVIEWALHPGRLPLTPADEARAASVAESSHATLRQAAITTGDGVILRAWYIRPAQGNGDAVILFHGQADNRAGMLGPAAMLLRHGYSVLLPDARGQGMSGGDIVTYGVREADDIRRWFEWLVETQGPRCIDALGESMGAAELLNSLKTERSFCAVTAESSFATFREASNDRIGEWTHTGPWLGRTILRPVVDFSFLSARRKFSVDLDEANPVRTVASSRVPVLLIHGLLDDNLPPRGSEEIVAEARRRGRDVELWEPPDAGHCGASGAEPQEFERRVAGWFESHQSAPVP